MEFEGFTYDGSSIQDGAEISEFMFDTPVTVAAASLPGRQAAAMGLKMQWIGGNGMSSTELVTQAGAGVAKGVIVTRGSVAVVMFALLVVAAGPSGARDLLALRLVDRSLRVRLREPRAQTGRRTMIYMGVSLAITVAGLLTAYLLYAVHKVEDLEKKQATAREDALAEFEANGRQKTIDDVNAKKYVDRDLSVTIISLEGVTLANLNAKLIGKNVLALKDSNDATVGYISDGYSNAGKCGSGTPSSVAAGPGLPRAVKPRLNSPSAIECSAAGRSTWIRDGGSAAGCKSSMSMLSMPHTIKRSIARVIAT